MHQKKALSQTSACDFDLFFPYLAYFPSYRASNEISAVKSGQKTVFGPKLPPAKIFSAQKCIIRDLLNCTLKIRYKSCFYHFCKAFICDGALFTPIFTLQATCLDLSMEIWKFFWHIIAYRFLYIYERKVSSFQLVKSLAAKVKVEKRGKKRVF